MIMDRTAWVGLALATLGAGGLLAVEMIGTAQASLTGTKSYIIAVSASETLQLEKAVCKTACEGPITTGSIGEATPVRRLACSRVVDAGIISVGWRCH